MPVIYRDKGTTGTQIEVLSGTIVGSVRKEVLSAVTGQHMTRRWTLLVAVAPPGFQHNGIADTRWTMWVEAAGLREKFEPLAVAPQPFARR